MSHEHFVERSGWTVVIRAASGREFMAYGPDDSSVLGRTFLPTRNAARQHVHELRSHGIKHTFVSRATVRLQRHV